jgi:hypothetical protein
MRKRLIHSARYPTRLGIYLLMLMLASVIVIYPIDVQADPAGVTLQRYYCTRENEWSTSSTSYIDVQPSSSYYPLQLTFTPPVDSPYLVIFCCSLSNANTSATTTVQVLQDTTQIYYRESTPYASGDWATPGFAEVRSHPQYVLYIQSAA